MEHHHEEHGYERPDGFGYDGDEYGTGPLGLINYTRCKRPVLFTALLGWAAVIFFLPEILWLTGW
jgi:hypothetical protein